MILTQVINYQYVKATNVYLTLGWYEKRVLPVGKIIIQVKLFFNTLGYLLLTFVWEEPGKYPHIKHYRI